MNPNDLFSKFQSPLWGNEFLKALEVWRKRQPPIPPNIQEIARLVNSKRTTPAVQEIEKLDRLAAKVSDAYRHMTPLLNHPALREVRRWNNEINSVLSGQHTPSSTTPNQESNELCAAVDALIEKAESHGIEKDPLPDEKTMQDVFFIVAFYVFTLTPQALNDWLDHAYEALKIQIHEAVNASGGVLRVAFLI